jgi:hypothetical protein
MLSPHGHPVVPHLREALELDSNTLQQLRADIVVYSGSRGHGSIMFVQVLQNALDLLLRDDHAVSIGTPPTVLDGRSTGCGVSHTRPFGSDERPGKRGSPKAGTLRLRGEGVAEATLLMRSLCRWHSRMQEGHLKMHEWKPMVGAGSRPVAMLYQLNGVSSAPIPATSGVSPMATVSAAATATAIVAGPGR